LIEATEKRGAVYFTVRVVPRASRSEVVGELDGALKVRLAAAPVDGSANAELAKLLAKHFEVPKNAVEIVSGHTSKTKQIRITGLTAAKLRSRVDLPTEKSA
jgi:uncharacterized protein (TIGR00251 family)